jgi:hypothetical protein
MRFKVLALILSVVSIASCGDSPQISPESPNLILAQAQFSRVTGEDGKTRTMPGAARLVLLYDVDGVWQSETLEDPDSNVFHKAVFTTMPTGEDGILTIGAEEAILKFWNFTGGAWLGRTIWRESFGGKFDRLRDFEIGDVTGDGKPDVVIATHDQGVVAVVELADIDRVHELDKESETFVHEIELGDVDGDGTIEIFATPSAPNKIDGTIQPGKITMFEFDGDGFTSSVLETFETRHVKEILCAELSGFENPVLLASLEGEKIGGSGDRGDSSRVRLYDFSSGDPEGVNIIGLPGQLCRFLTSGDVDGDGKNEVIASTHKSGIWLLERVNGDWAKSLIDKDSSGFEHATVIFDSDRDGIDEIFVAADDQGVVNHYSFDGTDFVKEELLGIDGDYITFNIMPGPMGE